MTTNQLVKGDNQMPEMLHITNMPKTMVYQQKLTTLYAMLLSCLLKT
jgi:hypothetical protein